MTSPLLYLAGDESGSLTNPYTAVVTAAMIMTPNPAPLRWVIPRIKRRVRQKSAKRGRIPELKFHNTTDAVRAAVLSNLGKEDVKIIAFNLYKGAQVIADTPENYGLLLYNLFKQCINEQPQPLDIIFDNHYTSRTRREALNVLIRARLPLENDIRFVDSQQSHLVQLADFVAGE